LARPGWRAPPAADGRGNVYILDGGHIRILSAAGVLTTPAVFALVTSAQQIAVAPAGDFYVLSGSVIRWYAADGSASAAVTPRDETGAPTAFHQIRAIAVDGAGVLYVVDAGYTTVDAIGHQYPNDLTRIERLTAPWSN
jgi:hypothetical protein